MKAPGNGVPLAAFGLVVWMVALPILLMRGGAPWYMASVVSLSLIVAAFIGHEVMIWNLRKDGYVVESRPDARGKSRYRVGVAEPPTAMPAVMWIAPGYPNAVPDRVALALGIQIASREDVDVEHGRFTARRVGPPR